MRRYRLTAYGNCYVWREAIYIGHWLERPATWLYIGRLRQLVRIPRGTPLAVEG